MPKYSKPWKEAFGIMPNYFHDENDTAQAKASQNLLIYALDSLLNQSIYLVPDMNDVGKANFRLYSSFFTTKKIASLQFSMRFNLAWAQTDCIRLMTMV